MAAEFLERMGSRMRQRREELGLGRDELARQLPGKVNGQQIYRWEKGLHRPHDDTLEALAGALEVDIAYFLTPEPEAGTAPLLEVLNGGGEDSLDAPARLDRMERRLQSVERLLRLLATDLLGVSEVELEQQLGHGSQGETRAPTQGESEAP